MLVIRLADAYQKKNDSRYCFGAIGYVSVRSPGDQKREKRGLNLVLRFFTPTTSKSSQLEARFAARRSMHPSESAIFYA
jgi:hypothetical protein